MLTENLQHIVDELQQLTPEQQDRVAAVLRSLLEHYPVTSDTIRPEVMSAFERVVERSPEVLAYLRDK
jgi:hypothetical protein